ncbi:DUF2752 domain-containing protein [Candidatus Sumerlaeota bacterium]|nr:DUF2752 domain-containing protein [Candidatus Sumerlaeota bacterium]
MSETVEEINAVPQPQPGFLLMLLSRTAGVIAILGIVVALIMPDRGIGPSLCGMYRIYGVPCPGCGMTRSVSCFFHLHFHESFLYNPFGLLFSIGLLLVAIQTLFPRGVMMRIADWIQQRQDQLIYLYIGLVTIFLLFGVVRIILIIFFPNHAFWLTCKFI